jgi:hypothetical protein
MPKEEFFHISGATKYLVISEGKLPKNEQENELDTQSKSSFFVRLLLNVQIFNLQFFEKQKNNAIFFVFLKLVCVFLLANFVSKKSSKQKKNYNGYLLLQRSEKKSKF